jgi:hypothetical protein
MIIEGRLWQYMKENIDDNIDIPQDYSVMLRSNIIYRNMMQKQISKYISRSDYVYISTHFFVSW